MSPEKKTASETNNDVEELELEHSFAPSQVTSFTIAPETEQFENQTIVSSNKENYASYSNTVTTDNSTSTTDTVNNVSAQLNNGVGKRLYIDNQPTNQQKFSRRKKRHGWV